MRTRARGAGQSSRLGTSIDAEMDEDGVDIPAGEGAPVVFGEIELGDGTAEGVAAGNIHTGGGEAEERFELSAASAATRERQEELLLALFGGGTIVGNPGPQTILKIHIFYS